MTVNISADEVFEKILKEYFVLAFTTNAEEATKYMMEEHPEYEWASAQVKDWFNARNAIYDVMLTLLHEEHVKNGSYRPIEFTG